MKTVLAEGNNIRNVVSCVRRYLAYPQGVGKIGTRNKAGEDCPGNWRIVFKDTGDVIEAYVRVGTPCKVTFCS